MNKKGNFPDVVEWLRFALAFGLVAIITLTFITNFNDNVQSNTDIPAQAKTGVDNLNDALPKGLDFLFLAVLMIFWSFSIMSARLIPSSPKFIIVSVFLIIALPFLSMFLENIWDGMAQQTAFTVAISSLPITNFVLNHLVWFSLFYSVTVGIALMTKQEGIV